VNLEFEKAKPSRKSERGGEISAGGFNMHLLTCCVPHTVPGFKKKSK